MITSLIKKESLFAGAVNDWKQLLGVNEGNLQIMGVDFSSDKIKSLVQTAIIVAVSGLVVLLVGLISYGGFKWITAGDNEEQLQKAKKIMKSGVIGLLITFGFLVLLGVLAAILGVGNITDFSFLDSLLGTE